MIPQRIRLMFKHLFQIFFFAISWACPHSLLQAKEELQQIPITLEFAKTADELTWGLMQRPSLPQDHGMLFIYPEPAKASIWMFNCLINLSVAFIDENGMIRQINELKAYPDKIDSKRPVRSPHELKLYSLKDPFIRFFEKRSVSTRFAVSFVLEMNAYWFQKHGVKVGDQLRWDEGSKTGTVIKIRH